MSGPRALEDDPVSFQDKTLTCKDCGQEFIWTAGEQEFYASRGLQNAPTRCPADRAARRAQGGGRGGGGGGGGYAGGGVVVDTAAVAAATAAASARCSP